MPELPEVETIKEDLRELVAGSRIERAEVLRDSLVEQPSKEEFERRLEGVEIAGARRRAKHLIVEFGFGEYLVWCFNSRSGASFLLVPPVEEPVSALMMIVLHLDGGRMLFLRDETRFHESATFRVKRNLRRAALLHWGRSRSVKADSAR